MARVSEDQRGRPESDGSRPCAALESFGPALLQGALSADAPLPDVLAASSRLFTCLREQLAPLIGPRGVTAVLERGLKLAASREPLLVQAKIGLDGIPLIPSPAELGPEAVERAMGELLGASAGLLCTLIGIDLAETILKRVERSFTSSGGIRA